MYLAIGPVYMMLFILICMTSLLSERIEEFGQHECAVHVTTSIFRAD